jgi:hypothetical protein
VDPIAEASGSGISLTDSRCDPAMEAGVSEQVWPPEEIVALR